MVATATVAATTATMAPATISTPIVPTPIIARTASSPVRSVREHGADAEKEDEARNDTEKLS